MNKIPLYVELQCENPYCKFEDNSVVTAIPLTLYKPGTYKCKKCNNELELTDRNNPGLYNFLLALKIF